MTLGNSNLEHRRSSLAALMLLLIGATLVTGCGERRESKATKADAALVSNQKERKILYWRAPMDPTYVSDKPGKSPMGMDLVPVYEGEELSGGPTVVIDPVTIQNMGVQTTTVQKVNLRRIIRTVGYLDYNETALQRVNIKFSGWVEHLFVDQTGQRVQKGQPMLSIYSPDLVATQEEYLLAYRNATKLAGSSFGDVARGGQSLLESARRRLRYWDITDRQIRDLEETGRVQKNITLYAPSDGVVIKKMVESGMHVMPGVDLYQLADLSNLWLYGQIYQDEVPFVRVGQPVEVHISYLPGKAYRGRVDFIYPFLDEKTRNVNVRIVVPNPSFQLKPQMFATVQFQSSVGGDVTAIPSDAVIRTGTRSVVFVARGGGKFAPRDVILGPEGQNGLVQVLAGVVPGENVVTSAEFMIDSESRLKDAIQKMLEARSPAPTPLLPEGPGQGHPFMDSSHPEAPGEERIPISPDGQMGSQMETDSSAEKGRATAREGEGGIEPTPPAMVKDPVCGMTIEPEEDLSFSYQGKKYYFCSEGDREKFKADPERYVSSPTAH